MNEQIDPQVLNIQARARIAVAQLLLAIPLSKPRSLSSDPGPLLDFHDVDAVMAWVEQMAPVGRITGNDYDEMEHANTCLAFKKGGWLPGVNCDADFNGEDADNYARWCVGQWLSARHSEMARFCREWRAKFRSGGA